MNEELSLLKEFDWNLVEFDYESGFICFTHELDEDAVIVFTRDYEGGEWDRNLWSLTIRLTDIIRNLGSIEVRIIDEMLQLLERYDVPYPKDDDVTDEMVDRRAALESKYLKYGYTVEEAISK